jgi:hypothetical protein
MRKMNALAGLVALLVLTASTAFADVTVTMQDGRVTIVAKDATVRQILTEWARVGQTKIVNVEKIAGGPMTIELTNVPEGQALDLLLRSVSGYMTAPRPVAVANLSQFDRVVVMPTSAPPRPAMAAQPASAGPTFAQPQYTPPPQVNTDDDVDDERPAPNVAVPAVAMPNGQVPNPRGPVFNTFPQPQVIAPQVLPPGMQLPPQQQPQQPQPTTTPTAPFGGVAVPGMIVQPAQQPGQPGQPVRRPGGPEDRQ